MKRLFEAVAERHQIPSNPGRCRCDKAQAPQIDQAVLGPLMITLVTASLEGQLEEPVTSEIFTDRE